MMNHKDTIKRIMIDLRQAAEMTLESLESVRYTYTDQDFKVIKAIKELLEAIERRDTVHQDISCKTHPDAPHGFNRNASH